MPHSVPIQQPSNRKVINVTQKINIAQKFTLFNEYFTPKIIAESNGQLVKIAKIKGDFVWHTHDNEDELFIVFKGNL